MAVTINYLYPGTSVPTAALATNTLVATVIATAAADTSAVITHQMNLPASDISSGFPWVNVIPQADETTSGWFEASENPNFTVLQKNTLGAGALAKVSIQRPHSIVR